MIASPVQTKARSLKDLYSALLSGILLALTFPKFDLEFLSWLAFIPLFIALDRVSRGRAFFLAFVCGLAFWGITIYWLMHVTMPGMIVLVFYLSLFFGLFGISFQYFSARLSLKSPEVRRLMGLLVFPAVWVMLEYARSYLLTGFPWALLGYSQYLSLPIIQIADIFGAWGVSFLVVMVNVGLYSAIREKKIENLIIPAIIFILVLGYGFYWLAPRNLRSAAGKSIKISVIQGNIPQELKWYPGARQEIMEKYSMLSRLAGKEKPDLIVWPEAAVPVILEEEPEYFEAVRELARQIKTPLLFGAVTSRENFFYNSCLMVSSEGAIAGRYDKLHLVPFGEYIPLRKILPFLETIAPIGDVNPGKEYTLFSVDLPGTGHSLRSKFGVLICFEDVFPGLSRQFALRGAQFLVNITNDAWYQRSFASYQHLQASIFRAVENRVFLLRSANTGVSGFISPEGRIMSLVKDDKGKELFVDGFKMQSIPGKKGGTSIYTRFGDWFIILLGLVIAAVFLILPGRRKNV